MKGTIFAAAALVGSAMAEGNIHRRHEALHQRWAASSSSAVATSSAAETCGCTTKVITYYGSPTLVPVSSTATPSPEETSTSTSTVSQTSTSTSTSTVTVPPSSVAPVSTSTATPTPTPSPTPAAPLPTAGTTSFSSTGVYTVPATTLVVTDTTTVCGATSTEVPSGTHTYGGVTTVVDTDTVVTCPYATQSPSGSTVTDIVAYTTYTCPVAGTYTVVPGTTTFVPTSTMLVYPTPSTITPGTYTQPETTITVVRTDYTYVCPFATSTTSTATPAPAPPATTTAAPATEATEMPTGVAAVSTSTSAPAAPATGGLLSAMNGVVGDVGNVVGNVGNVVGNVVGDVGNVLSGLLPGQPLTGTNQYGMTFDPYTASGACMTQQEVSQNIGTMASKGFKAVRVYSTDCNTLQYVGSACKQFGMKMIPGVYVDQTGVSAAQSQIDEIASWAQWAQVDVIVVGNEAISYGYATAAEMAGLVSSAKSAFQAAGFTGPVTTSEPINIWQMYGVSDLCSSVDLVGANIHPFFNAANTASSAGEFVLSEYKILKNICGKDVLNLETGWPTQGQANGLAVPGVSEQQTAIHGIAKTLGAKSVFFSYQNNQWTSPGAFGVEPFWGCVDLF